MLLKEVIWLINNLITVEENACSFAARNFAEHIYMLCLCHHEQFDFDIWRIICWFMRLMNHTLRFSENAFEDNIMHVLWLSKFQDKICSHLSAPFANDPRAQYRTLLKKDLVLFVAGCFDHASEEQLQCFMQSPYTLAEAMVRLLQETQGNSDYTAKLLKVVGQLMYESDTLCSHLVSATGHGSVASELRVMLELERIFVESIGTNHKVAETILWILSNVAINSVADLDAVLNSGILTNVVASCSHSETSMRKEAIITLSDFVVRLASLQQHDKLREFMLKYSIESTLIGVLEASI